MVRYLVPRSLVASTWHQLPGTIVGGTWQQVPGSSCVPGTMHLVRAARYLVPGTCYQVTLPGTRYLVLYLIEQKSLVHKQLLVRGCLPATLCAACAGGIVR